MCRGDSKFYNFASFEVDVEEIEVSRKVRKTIKLE
jgi:hypothetical protein